MKNAFRFVLSTMLAVTILLSGSSFTLGKMVCLETGYTVIDYKKVEDCCDAHKPAPVVVRENCCEVTNLDITIDYFVQNNTSVAKMEAVPAPFHAVVQFCSVVPSFSTADFIPSFSQPPPETAEEILQRIRQYRI